ncbi:MAG: T9SS type A sorting domain-containing protein [Bacteroidetes bacterium]|jgi:hypothetical protein|nr:T9SS type A sorting domain-containing protein [Bacteroidota bacterium]
MKQQLLFFFLFAACFQLQAQFAEVSYGPGYTQQVFYDLGSQEAVSVDDAAWDIAFTAQGLQDAGVFLNEAASSDENDSALELYLVPDKAYDETLTEDHLGERLYNNEQNWQYGAFNAMRTAGDPFDYGWGSYNPATMSVEGTQLFALKLRDGSFRKLEISALDGTSYQVRHAAFDGSGEVSFSVDKSNHQDTGLVFYSLTSNEVVTEIPATGDWDLMFTRYTTPLDDGQGNILNYLLTGTLSGAGVEVAQADGIDPATVEFDAYRDSLQSALDVIGYDWKSFDLNTFSWSLPLDRVYFVKTAEGEVYKLQFIDFEGSSTGVAVFEQTDLGITNTIEESSIVNDFTVFPNPVRDVATIGLTLEQTTRARMQLFSANGQQVWAAEAQFPAGFQAKELNLSHLPGGTYYLSIQPQHSRPVSIPLIIAPQ